MTREQVLEIAYIKAIDLRVNYTWDKYVSLFSMICDFNSEHYGEDEIFLADDEFGFYLEDDHFIYPEMEEEFAKL